MIFKSFIIAAVAILPSQRVFVKAHGYPTSPRSRNFYAHDIINTSECQGGAGCPPAEYCPHCLNLNDGVCGKTTQRSFETDNWLDKNGNGMPWIAQATYTEGGTITFSSYLATHHNGHMELRACKVEGSNSCSRPEDFLGNELHFVKDNAIGSHPPMPKDLNYPERGMYGGGSGGGIQNFEFEFKLPNGMSGDKVLLQWKYITANSCSPPGYAAYFASNSNLPASYWKPGVIECTPPYPNDGSRSSTWPEQFFNCAEVNIQPSGSTNPPPPSPSPPRPSLRPTKKPTATVGGPAYCNWGPAGTGASSTCNGEVQGGDWCNVGQGNCEGGCGGRWCTTGGGGGGGGASKCGCNSCTDSILERNADGYSVGSRIDWVQANMGRSENDACSLVCGDEFPGICGECNAGQC